MLFMVKKITTIISLRVTKCLACFHGYLKISAINFDQINNSYLDSTTYLLTPILAMLSTFSIVLNIY